MSPKTKIRPEFFANKKAFRNVKRKAESVNIKRAKRNMLNLSKTSSTKFWKKIKKSRKGKLSSSDRVSIQSTLVISNSKGLSETLRDMRTSTYQIFRTEEKNNSNNHI